MKVLLGIAVLVILVLGFLLWRQQNGTGSTAQQHGKGGLGSDDNSPIVIADGSIRIYHQKAKDYFVSKNLFDAVIQHANYMPNKLGYLCDVGGTGCASVSSCPSGSNSNACIVDLSKGNWLLGLCGANTCASMPDMAVWGDPGDGYLAFTNFGGLFSYKAASNGQGAEVDYTNNNNGLGSASLIIYSNNTPTTYSFACSSGSKKMCMTLDYYCSGNSGACDQ